MKTKKNLTSVLSSLLLAGCFITNRQASAQEMGNGAGQYQDRFVINEDDTNHFAFLRLQTHNNRAWNIINQGEGDNYGSLWWGYAANNIDTDLGGEQMRLFTNGNLRAAGKFISGNSENGVFLPFINWEDTRGFLIRQGSDNAFFGLINRAGENIGDNNYNTVLYFGDDLDDDLEFRSQGAGELMRLTGDGMLGIGTSNPETKLHVLGDIRVDNGGRYMSHGPIVLRPDSDNTGDDSIIFLNNQEQEHMRIDETGKIGIGTNSPEAMLHVTGKLISGSGGGFVRDNINWSDTRGIFVSKGTDNAFFGLINRVGPGSGDNSYNTVLYFGDDYDDDLEFRSYGGGELMRVTGDGNVGIGTAAPTEKLEVSGTVKATSFVSSAASFPDYVFASGYSILPLSELETYVKRHKRLPNMPSEKEVVEQGLNMSDVVIKSVENIETIYLHLIRMEKEIKVLKQENNVLKQQLKQDR